MDYEVIGAALAVIGALLWIRRDLRQDIRGLGARLDAVESSLRADIRALNGRIDNILLTPRKPS